MKEVKNKSFANGSVYCLKLSDGFLIETTDTFLPYYTKHCYNNNNELRNNILASRKERWMIGASVMSGCPVRCKFCATGKMKRWRNLDSEEIIKQVKFILDKNNKINPSVSKEFKINYTRMGEPFLNIDNVKEAINYISGIYPNTHHYISTIGLKDSDFSWIKDNITLQISLHSLNEERRNNLIPIKNLLSIEELGKIRTKSKLKTTINLTLVNELDFDLEKIKKYFDPKYFFIKLSPINKNVISESNLLGSGIIESINLI